MQTFDLSLGGIAPCATLPCFTAEQEAGSLLRAITPRKRRAMRKRIIAAVVGICIAALMTTSCGTVSGAAVDAGAVYDI